MFFFYVDSDGMSIRGVRESRESRHRPRLHGLDRHAVINKEQDTAMVRTLLGISTILFCSICIYNNNNKYF